MSRLIKDRMVAAYKERFGDVTSVALVNSQGVDVMEMVSLRAAFRARGLEAMVVQNRLWGLALAETDLAALKPLLTGPNTVVWGGESIVEIAKAVVEQASSVDELEVRGGVSDGQLLTKEDVDALSKLPSREELIGMIVGRAVGQASRVVMLATSPGSRILGQVRECEGDSSGAEWDAGGDAATAEAESASGASEAAGSGEAAAKGEAKDDEEQAEA